MCRSGYKHKLLQLSTLAIAMLSMNVLASSENDVSLQYDVVQLKKEQIAEVPYSVLAIFPNDPRYNFNQKMRFSLNQKGYRPLADQLLSTKNRNPFTLTDILVGYAYLHHWNYNQDDIRESNMHHFNQIVGQKFSANEFNSEGNLFSYLLRNKDYLVAEYYALNLLEKSLKERDGYAREQYAALVNFFDKEVTKKYDVYKENDIAKNIYQMVLRKLPQKLAGDINVQFYFKSLLYKDEMLRQITEVILLNNYEPEEIGKITFGADLVVRLAKEKHYPILIDNSQNKTLATLNRPDFTGWYERVYEKDFNEDQIAKFFGINRFVFIEPKEKSLKLFNISLYSKNIPIHIKGTFNSNGRGIDFYHDGLLYYIAQSKNKKYIKVFVSPEEGIGKTFTFKRVKGFIPYALNKETKFLKSSTKHVYKKGINLYVTKESASYNNIYQAWKDIVGKNILEDFYKDEAIEDWNTKGHYSFEPSTKQCDALSVDSMENCVDQLKMTDILLSNHACYNKDIGIGATNVALSKGIVGRLYFSGEQENNYKTNTLVLDLPFKDQNKMKHLCITTSFYMRDIDVIDALEFNNNMINNILVGDKNEHQ